MNIGYLEGTAVDSDCILTKNGVGILVKTPNPLTVEKPVALWIHTSISENNITHYGFNSKNEKLLFQNLIKIQGVGPKAASDLLAAGNLNQITTALTQKDEQWLTTVKGIGPGTAKKIIQNIKIPEEIQPAATTLQQPTATQQPETTGNDLADKIIELTNKPATEVLLTLEKLKAQYTEEADLLSNALKELL